VTCVLDEVPGADFPMLGQPVDLTNQLEAYRKIASCRGRGLPRRHRDLAAEFLGRARDASTSLTEK
jgi:hypothetical protein